VSYSRTIFVYADWVGLNGPKLVGELHVQSARGKESFSFSYDDSWLRTKNNVSIDPELLLYPGLQHTPLHKRAFGVFLDSAPDRWGRTIMQQRAAHESRTRGVGVTSLMDSDFLLGVHDAARLGGLRFRSTLDGPFLDDNDAYAAPPMTSLRRLQEISLRFERDEIDDLELGNILQLLAPGSSLGGARPKSGVIDQHGHLWIAKFPSASDSWDVAAWECVATTLASTCGIATPEVRLERFGSGHHTLLSKRFDRRGDERIHAASAITLLGRVDGDDHTTGAGYLELADLIIRRGVNVSEQLEELWKRILFNVLISNTDDHLRNHSFLLEEDGSWQLSPAYDMNPVPYGQGLRLNITETDNTRSVELVQHVAPMFRIQPNRAIELISFMRSIIETWPEVATSFGIPRRELRIMQDAFSRPE
jgi:serine/threonine-protein kinase HipA